MIITTLHKMLTEAGFSFETGDVYMPPAHEPKDFPVAPNKRPAVKVGADHPDLHKSFPVGVDTHDDLFSACPRFVAYDNGWVYFPVWAHGGTEIYRVAVHPGTYMGLGFHPTPFPY